MRQLFFIISASGLIGAVIGLFRYDDGCLETEHRVLIGALNSFVVIGGAAGFVAFGSRWSAGSTWRYALLSISSGLATVALATALSIAVVRPLIAPAPLRPADYLFVFYVPGFLMFLAVAHTLHLRERNREFGRALAEYRERSRAPGDPGEVVESSAESGSVLTISGGESKIEIATDTIVYVSSRGKKSVLHTEAGDYEMRALLKDVLDELPRHFLRVHKSYLVNLRHADRVRYRFGGNYEITLRDEDDTTLPVGRSHLSRLRRALREPFAE